MCVLFIVSQEPEQYCSEGTAVAMAKAAYQRAAQLCGFGASIVGVGATCALATVSQLLLINIKNFIHGCCIR